MKKKKRILLVFIKQVYNDARSRKCEKYQRQLDSWSRALD